MLKFINLTHTHKHARTHTHLHSTRKHTYTRAHIHTRAHTNTHIYTCVCVCVCVFRMYVFTNTHITICIYDNIMSVNESSIPNNFSKVTKVKRSFGNKVTGVRKATKVNFTGCECFLRTHLARTIHGSLTINHELQTNIISTLLLAILL